MFKLLISNSKQVFERFGFRGKKGEKRRKTWGEKTWIKYMAKDNINKSVKRGKIEREIK